MLYFQIDILWEKYGDLKADVELLKSLYRQLVNNDDVVIVSISTICII